MPQQAARKGITTDMLSFIRRLKSAREFAVAVDLFNERKLDDAEKLVKAAIARSGADFILPHLLHFQILTFRGDISAALTKRNSIEADLLPKSRLNNATKNYVRYCMLHNIPDEVLSTMDATDIHDPLNRSLSKVQAAYSTWYPYRPPRKSVLTVLRRR